MASSRESSPAGDSSPSSPAQLTPRSKVNAMLAQFDDSSDDEKDNVGSGRTRLTDKSKQAATRPTEDTALVQEKVEGNEAITGPDQDSEEDDDIVQPNRRRAKVQVDEEDGEEEHQPPAETARERVRRMLMAKDKSPEKAKESKNDQDDDEEDVPIQRRQRKIRASSHNTPKSTPRKEAASPGLFVSPEAPKTAHPIGDGSDSDDLPANPATSERVLALAEKMRQERKAKEAKAKKETDERAAKLKKQASLLANDDSEGSEDDGRRQLTQQANPTRKASKKALEDIARESQRLARNHQSTYKATTKKKFTKAIFFDKFNFHPNGVASPLESVQATSSSSAPHSDVEMHDTPPTSPASHDDSVIGKLGVVEDVGTASNINEVEHEDDDELPDVGDILSQMPTTRVDKGKGKAKEEDSPAKPMPKKPKFTQRPIRVRPPRNVTKADDSDDDLEIVTTKPSKPKSKLDQYLERLPAEKANKGSRSLIALRILAHLTSPGKQSVGKNKKPSMNASTLHTSLQERARQQATRERQERIQALIDKGIIVQSAEEREKEMAEVEDIMAKARREGEELMKKERAAAKQQRAANGEVDPLGDSSDDEDWEEGKEKSTGKASESDGEDEMEGSEDESDDADSEDEKDNEESIALDGQEEENVTSNPLFDEEASESEEEEIDTKPLDEDIHEDQGVEDNEEENLPVNQSQRTRKSNVISDDEDEDADVKQTPEPLRTDSPMHPKTDSPAAPNSVLRSASKTFIPGLTVAGPAGLGLTQIFAGTMDDSQMKGSQTSPTAPNAESQQMDSQQDSMAFLRMLPPPTMPPFEPTMADDTQELVKDSQSQVLESQPVVDESPMKLAYSQSQIHGFDSLVQDQFSDFGDATQDAGFDKMTPLTGRFADPPPSTVETVVLPPVTSVPPETPTVKPKRKLRQKIQVAALSDDEDATQGVGDVLDDPNNAFALMQKASKKKVLDDFDKKKSHAKVMVHEQAEESDDEYAGLGGGSDDDSGEEDAFVKEMIDDEVGKNVDESKLAAFFADCERANDEKQIEKLYKDITKGMLRRKRGAEYDLSDSDDDGAARKRMKQREFAKMQKALLADERIGKIAENPKRQAFLRSIQDRGSDDDMDFLDEPTEQMQETDSQSQHPSQQEDSQQRIPDSQPEVMGPPTKRKFVEDPTSTTQQRPPPHLHRTKPDKRPSSLSEVRESLSSLIEDPNSLPLANSDNESEEDELDITGAPETSRNPEKDTHQDKENLSPFYSRRRTSIPIIDRISLKRNASSGLSSNNPRLAFAADSSSAPGFKVPPLLRRATTNNSLASSSTTSGASSFSAGGSVNGLSATERMAGGLDGGNWGMIKKGAGRNSGVNYFARESERKAKVVKTEKRREEKMIKGARVRRKVVGGLFGSGRFE